METPFALEEPKYRRRVEGMGSHHSAHSETDVWLTPPELLTRLGTFDLDPCAPLNRPWDTAKEHYTIEDDGLTCEWTGRVWLNPPYGRETGTWLHRLKEHGNGIALVFARTETEAWFAHIWNDAAAVLFVRGRINFYHASGRRSDKNCGAPVALVAYGQNNARILKECGVVGAFISLKRECIDADSDSLSSRAQMAGA